MCAKSTFKKIRNASLLRTVTHRGLFSHHASSHSSPPAAEPSPADTFVFSTNLNPPTAPPFDLWPQKTVTRPPPAERTYGAGCVEASDLEPPAVSYFVSSFRRGRSLFAFTQILEPVHSSRKAQFPKIMKTYERFYAVMSMIQGDKILINEVRKYPFIYDQKHEHYKDTRLKEETWAAIGSTINVKPADAKNRWRNLRDRYAREKKMLITEGEEAYRRHEVWPYLEDMSFLWDLIVHRKCSNSYQNGAEETKKAKPKSKDKQIPQLIPKPMQEWINSALANGGLNPFAAAAALNLNETPVTNGDVVEVDPWACSINEANDEDSDLQPSQSKLRKLLLDHSEESRVGTPNSSRSGEYNSAADLAASVRQKQSRKQSSHVPYDEDQLFCLSVAASLKRFSTKTKAITKIKIQQLLYEAEFHDESDVVNGLDTPTKGDTT